MPICHKRHVAYFLSNYCDYWIEQRYITSMDFSNTDLVRRLHANSRDLRPLLQLAPVAVHMSLSHDGAA